MEIENVLFVLWMLVQRTTITIGPTTRCEAPPVFKGEAAVITCFFHVNVEQTESDFEVHKRNEEGMQDVLDCYWTEHKIPKCTNNELGYELDGKPTNTVRLKAQSATEKHEGDYVCQVIPAHGIDVTPCSLKLKGKASHSTEAATSTTTPRILLETKTPESGTPLEYSKHFTAAIVVCVACQTVAVLLTLFVVWICKKKTGKKKEGQDEEGMASLISATGDCSYPQNNVSSHQMEIRGTSRNLNIPNSVTFELFSRLHRRALKAYAAVEAAKPYVERMHRENLPVSVLIVGKNDLGIWAIQFLRHLETSDQILDVYIAGSSTEMLASAEEHGCDNTIHWNEEEHEEDLVDLTNDVCCSRVNIVIDFVSSTRTVQRSLKVLSSDGVILAKKIPPSISNDHARVFPNGTLHQLQDLVNLASERKITPLEHKRFQEGKNLVFRRGFEKFEGVGRS